MNPLELADHGPVIPVLVIHRVEDAVPLARALVEGGVRVLEVTLRTPAALACMEAIARAVPEAIVGAGTVRSAADAQAAAMAGAAFTVAALAGAALAAAYLGAAALTGAAFAVGFVAGLLAAARLRAVAGLAARFGAATAIAWARATVWVSSVTCDVSLDKIV